MRPVLMFEVGLDFSLITIMPGGNESDQALSLWAADFLIRLVGEHCSDMDIGIFCSDGHHDFQAHLSLTFRK